MATTLREATQQESEQSAASETQSRTAAETLGSSGSNATRRAPFVLRRRPLMVASAILAAGGLWGITQLMSSAGHESGLIFYQVGRTDLPVTIVERGTLQSQDNVEINSEVEDVRGDGIDGNPILWIIPNGTLVEKGALICQLDESSHVERLDQQILATDRARASQIQADLKYQNQITQNETTLAKAKLDVELAKLELQMFEDENGGTFQIDVQQVDMQIREAQAKRLIAETDLAAVDELYKLGYRNKGELAAARLSALSAEQDLARLMSLRSKKVDYEYQMQKLELTGKLQTAERRLEQVVRDNDAVLSQAKAKLDAANQALEKEDERLARYQEHLDNCKIYAPSDGMVAYAVSNDRWRRGQEIAEGVAVRERQHILSIPNLREMQVKTAIHESVVDRAEAGMDVIVRIDAFPELSYRGTVDSVSVLPDPSGWLNSDTKVYTTIVKINEEVSGLKPGMTAVVEIQVDHLQDVVAIPVQAVVQIDDQNWCHVRSGSGLERRPVKLGLTNDKFVQIVEGLAEGEEVVLNPMALMETGEPTE